MENDDTTENNDCMKAISRIAVSASKLKTLCELTIDYADVNEKDTHTMLYIIRDYVEDIKEIADNTIK